MNIYMQAKQKENKLIKSLVDRMDSSFEKVRITEYCPADLVVKKNNNYFCAEVKSRTYGIEFFKKYGVMVEDYKLNKVKELYKCDKLILFTITSDGYILRSVIDNETPISYKRCAKTTAFSNNNIVEKKFRISNQFNIIGEYDDVIRFRIN